MFMNKSSVAEDFSLRNCENVNKSKRKRFPFFTVSYKIDVYVMTEVI